MRYSNHLRFNQDTMEGYCKRFDGRVVLCFDMQDGHLSLQMSYQRSNRAYLRLFCGL